MKDQTPLWAVLHWLYQGICHGSAFLVASKWKYWRALAKSRAHIPKSLKKDVGITASWGLSCYKIVELFQKSWQLFRTNKQFQLRW